MDHVKTFFKTLFWTLLFLVIVVGGFGAYLRFFNQDMAKTVFALVYDMDKFQQTQECPETQKCPVCEIVEPKDNIQQESEKSEEPNSILDFESIDTKLDNILELLTKTSKNIDNLNNDTDAVEILKPKTQEELIQELMNRIEELEKDN